MPPSPELQSPQPFSKPNCLPDHSTEENIHRLLSGLEVGICWSDISEISYKAKVSTAPCLACGTRDAGAQARV